MKEKIRKWLRPLLFILGGMAAGYLYYRFFGCAGGNCAITSSPVRSMLYMGIVGWLLSVILKKEDKSCSI